MSARKLSPAQLALLRAAADRKVHRSYYGPFPRFVNEATGALVLDSTLRVLYDRGLARTVREPERAYLLPTAAGRAHLAELDAATP